MGSSDRHSAALIDRAGSVDWWCVPPVGVRSATRSGSGHWVIRPDKPSEIERADVGDALVQRTVCRAARREVAVSDAAALDPGARGHDVGL